MFMLMMCVIMVMFVGVPCRLVGVFRVTVAMGHFLMSVLMLMRLFFGHV